MSSLLNSQEGQVTSRLNLSDLLVIDGEGAEGNLVEVLLSRPLKLLSPGVVSEPVANEVGITGVDQDGDLGKEVDNELVEGKHPVTVEKEVAVDVKVAGFVGGNLSSESLHNLLLVQVLRNPSKLGIAEVVVVLARATDVVDVDTGALVRTNHGVVTVDGGGDTGPDRLGLVARLDQRGTTGKRLVHGLALRFGKDSGVSSLSTGHGAVVLVLGKTVGETVTDGDGLEVDVALLVRENLSSELRNVVSGVRLSGDVEVLRSVLGELLEEHGQERVNVLSSSLSAGDGIVGVGVSNVDGLVKEDHGRVRVP